MIGTITALLVAIVGVLAWRYVSSSPHKGKDRRELADVLLLLVRSMGNGGKLHARVEKHDVALCFERASGDDSSAVVSLIVQADSSPERFEKIAAALGPSDATESQVAVWNVTNIWDDACVAPIVHRTWRLLDALEVPPAARIDFWFHGPASGRWFRKLRAEH